MLVYRNNPTYIYIHTIPLPLPLTLPLPLPLPLTLPLTLYYITLHYIALHYITLHPSIHPYIHLFQTISIIEKNRSTLAPRSGGSPGRCLRCLLRRRALGQQVPPVLLFRGRSRGKCWESGENAGEMMGT